MRLETRPVLTSEGRQQDDEDRDGPGSDDAQDDEDHHSHQDRDEEQQQSGSERYDGQTGEEEEDEGEEDEDHGSAVHVEEDLPPQPQDGQNNAVNDEHQQEDLVPQPPRGEENDAAAVDGVVAQPRPSSPSSSARSESSSVIAEVTVERTAALDCGICFLPLKPPIFMVRLSS